MRSFRTLRRSFLIAAGAAVLPGMVAAQEGFLYQSPIVTLSLRFGASVPAANDEIHRFFTDTLTLDRKDFAGSTIGGDVAIRLSNRADLLVGLSYASVKKRSEFTNWVHEDDTPIEQTTMLRRTPLVVGGRFFLLERGRSVSNYAWVPTRFAPYVGAAVGKTWYKLEQDGEFVDYQDLDILLLTLQSSGSSEQAHLFGGAEFWVHPRVAFTAEGRYSWGSATLNEDFRAFNEIDLRGFQLTAGLATRF